MISFNSEKKNPLLALLNLKRLVMPEANPPLAENFTEKRLASPRPPASRYRSRRLRAGSGRANDFIS